MAQKLNGEEDGPRSSKTDAVNRAGLMVKRHSLRDQSFWTYPEKVRTIAWSKAIGKEAKGLGGFDLGKV